MEEPTNRTTEMSCSPRYAADQTRRGFIWCLVLFVVFSPLHKPKNFISKYYVVDFTKRNETTSRKRVVFVVFVVFIFKHARLHDRRTCGRWACVPFFYCFRINYLLNVKVNCACFVSSRARS